ncbi:MAG TPA: hypothetical protein VFI69_01020 [Candidatus Limnocylindrales bacterium]|nr:hypothetical protein [Candidatus Limnocylindrales bacterium]
MSRVRRARLAIAVAMLGVGLTVAGCGAGGGVALETFPAGSLGPSGTVGPAVAQTRGDLVRVLGQRNLVLQDSQAAFRPPEDRRFTEAPRALYQVILPQAPSQGFVVVYEFADPTAAAEAADEQARYLATGPARVQSAFGTRHVMRLVGSTVVLYSWVPDGVEDPRQPDIQTALETLGVGVPIPS